MNLLHSIILGIIQGLTEFFPISSSAHLALLEQIFGIRAKLQITVFIHFGSALALILAMSREIKLIITQEHRLIWALILGSIPAAVTGLFLLKKVELTFESPLIIAICLIVTGIILWLTRGMGENRRRPAPTLRDAFLIGIAQAIAIIPGISRSGITIATGIYLGIGRVRAAKFSFLLAIISILGANIFILPKLSTFDLQPSTLIIGLLFSFITSYFAITSLLKIVKTKNFSLFSIYCWLLGFLILLST